VDQGHIEIVVAGLLFAVSTLVTAARLVGVPYPVFLVLGGLIIGLLPGITPVQLDPDLVLLIFLPPLLYSAAFFTPLRELRRNVAPIGMLAIGLVLATCVAVAVVAHAVIPGLDWPTAFTLGAIVSPTDPVAATAIASRLRVPQRIVTVVEGEGLINDATALVAYKVGVAAVVTGAFSVADASGKFVVGALGGIAIGLVVGFVVAEVRARLHDPPVEITISILTAYLAYLPAEELGVSGVVAAVTVGLYMGSQTSRVTDGTVRMQSAPVWEILVFLLNSFLFVLVGLQVGGIVDTLRGTGFTTGQLLWYATAASLTVIVVRLAWIFLFTHLPGVRRLLGTGDIRAGGSVLVGWMGMRGSVSLAAALALPATTAAGTPFPHRDIVVFVVFGVILATLVMQGLTLPALISALGIEDDGADRREEENRARLAATRAGLARLDAIKDEGWARDLSVERLRRLLDYRQQRFTSRLDDDHDGEDYERITGGWTRLSLETINAQREALERLRREGAIDDDVMRAVERDLDLEEARLLGDS
jgi:CPA1 family monovalent cation:H+ antiporter